MSAPSRRRPNAPWYAWMGGAMFVASLGYFCYTYFIRMGRPVEAVGLPPAAAVAVDTLLFGVFALHHSLLARSGAKRRLSRHLDARLERTLYVWVASLFFVAVCWAWVGIPGLAYAHHGSAAAAHWAVVAVGGWLTLLAARSIEPLELSGIRQAAGDVRPAAFTIQGPYRLVRHPIYLGWILLVFGVPVMTWTRFWFAVISTCYLVIAIPFEERSLVETFGDAYSQYQRDVRWRLLPGVW